jgi:hypothetical protein
LSIASQIRAVRMHAHTAQQFGLVTRAQLAAAGWTRQQVHRAVAGGRLLPVHPGVWRIPGTPRSWDQQLLAAVLAAGAGAAASHRSALALHSVAPARREPPTPIEVSVHGRRGARITGARVHRVHLPQDHLTRIDGIPVTTYERTLIDSAARLGPKQLSEALDVGLASGRVGLRSLRAVIDDLAPAPGRRRAALLHLLDGHAPGADTTQSVKETRLLDVLHRAGLPAPVTQYRVTIGGEDFFIDAAYPDLRIGMEYLGWAGHRSRAAFEADHRRDRLLTLDGWDIAYFTRTSTDDEIADTVVRLRATSRFA